MSSHFLQQIFSTQGSNPGLLCLLHWQVDSSPLSHLGSPGKIPGHIKIQGEAMDCKQRPGEGMLLADNREGERVPMGVDSIFCVYFSVWYCEGGNWEPGNTGGSQENAARQEVGSWRSTRMQRVVQTNGIIQGHLVTVGHSLKTRKEDEILRFRA